jgi:peptidoglycan/LPS O-acetylase OafA/YrhL
MDPQVSVLIQTRPPETRDNPRGGDIPALTGLRFIAALSVVLAHGSFQILKFTPPDALGSCLARLGPFGMTLFFVLSGFVIHYNYRYLATRQGWAGFGTFLWARFARLYPLFLLVLTFDILFGQPLYDFLAGSGIRFMDILRALPYYLLFMQSWAYVPFDDRALVDVMGGVISLSWSISTEWFFYLAYPLIAWLVLRARRPVIILTVMLGWSLFWGGLASALDSSGEEIDGWAIGHYGPIAAAGDGSANSFIHWIEYYSPYLRIGEFILGCLTAQLYLQQRDRIVSAREQRIGTLLLTLGVVSIPLILFFSFSHEYRSPLLSGLRNNYALAPSIALILFSVARYENPLSRLLQGRFVVALGEASYSIYLTHLMIFALVSVYVTQILPTTAPYMLYLTLRMIFVVLLVCLFSLGLHSVLEVPARRWLRAMWRPGNSHRRRGAIALVIAPAAAALFSLWLGTYFFPDKGLVAAGIRVVSATYGANCGVSRGNVTRMLVDACNGQDHCDYIIDVNKLGDPAGGCAKDFNVEYACMPDGLPEAAGLPGEAGLGSRLSFRCDDAAASAGAAPGR